MRPAASIGRSLLSLRHRDQQVHSMDGHDSPDSDPILSFDRHVSFLLHSLLPSVDDVTSSFLSLSWINKLLHSFLLLLDDFTSLVFPSPNLPYCPLLDRLVSDFFDRSVKALDLLNAVRDGLDRVRHCRVHLDIAVSAIASRKLQRATKSLADLSLLLNDAGSTGPVYSHPNRSFIPNRRHHLRTLSWSVSRTWSAARQLQAMGSNLAPPKPADIAGTAGLALPVFTLSSVLLFVSWALVAAVPCQDRGLQAHLSLPRNYPWAAPMISLQERILEESKKRERDRKSNNASCLMLEICTVEKATKNLTEILNESMDAKEVTERISELEEVRDSLKEGLEGLERKVREVFHRIVRSRMEGLDCLTRRRVEVSGGREFTNEVADVATTLMEDLAVAGEICT